MSQHNEDRDKVVQALGGKKGLIDSGVPAVVFLIVFNVTQEVNTAIWAALSLSVTLAIIRLIMKDTIQHSVSGVIGVLICAYFANRSGNATDFYIPKLLTNLGYGTVYLIANLAGWPILGLVLGPLLGEKEVTVTSVDADRAVAGVVSTNPSYIMNAGLEAEHVAIVALTGRVPCRVTGTVRKGDLMVSAGYGLARAEADPHVGTVIGKALENHEGAESVIEVVVGRF
jgi:hypothetical protein